MNMLHWTRKLGLGLLACLALGTAQAQPLDGPLRLVVGFTPGGVSDRAARIVGEKLQARLGVPVIVDNKPGAGGRLAAQQAKNAPAGQNVLLLANPAMMVMAPLMFKDNGYDPERDFVPVSHINNFEIGVAVGSAVPVRELSHLLAWLRANPEQANFGVPATGSLPHFFALMAGQKAGVKPQVVGYRGSGPLVTDLMGGQVPLAFDSLDSLLPQHESGKIRILAVASARRSPYAAGIPTLKEAGLDLVAFSWNVLFAPASMAPTKVDRLGQAIREVMQDPDTQRKFIDARTTPVVSTPAQTAAMLKAYRAQWTPVVQQASVQP